MDTLKQIKKFIRGNVTQDEKILEEYSKDASIYKIKPSMVVFPKDSADISQLVKFVAAQKASGQNISITTRSGGTDMTGGPLSESIVLSMPKYFNQIKKIGTDYAIVQPGVYYRDFEKASLKKGLLLPSFPASRELCTVGGMVANNSGGELNLLYGKTERYVQELKMVLRDGNEYTFKPLSPEELQIKIALPGVEGEIYGQLFKLIYQNYDVIKKARPNVSKNSAGYYLWNVYDKSTGKFDLCKLIVGSQGTFGIITEIKFGLVKPKRREHLLVVFLNDLGIIPQITNQLLAFKPQSIESYDDQTFKVAMRLLPDIMKRLKGGFFKLVIGFLPELWMVISGGIPKLVMLVEFSADSEDEAMRQTEAAQKALQKFKVRTKLVVSNVDARKYWIIRRESFNLLRHHVHGMRTAPFIDDFVVKPEVLGEFLPKLYAILDKYRLLYTIAGHVGDGNFHIIPLMKVGDPKAPEVIKQMGDEVYKLVFAYKGSMTGEHNDGLVRGPYLKQMYGTKIYDLFVQTKRIFDPDDIFNPGKKVEARTEYAFKHLDFN